MEDNSQQQKTYETEDISMKMYKKSLVFYVLLIFGFVGSATAVYYYFIPNDGFNYNNVQKSKIPYTSRLQGNIMVQKDIVDLRQKELEAQTNYQWLNGEKTKVSLPIKKTMEIVLKEGINPSQSGTKTQ